jgi:hypothetical protein
LVLSINRSKADVHRQAANVRNERVGENLVVFPDSSKKALPVIRVCDIFYSGLRLIFLIFTII